MSITPLDCFRATVAHQPHEAVLAHASFTPDLLARLQQRYGLGPNGNPSRHFGLLEPVGVEPVKTAATPVQDFGPYFQGVEIPSGTTFNDWGLVRLPVGFYHFTELVSPLRHATTFAEIRGFPYPVYVGYDESQMAARVRAAHARGLVTQGRIGHLFEAAWQIRGMESFLVEMVTEPERCEHILDRLHAWQKGRALAVARAGVDILFTGDDVATQQAMMFSVDLWRRYLKPRWADIYRAAKEIHPGIKIRYHSDGNIMAIIPELIEIGVDILNPVQPECLDPFEVKRRFGTQLVLDGCMGTQSVFPFGTPEDVRRTVRTYVERLGADGALILAPTHVLEPEVPIANIAAFVETVREFGDLAPA